MKIKISEYAKLKGVTYRTIWNWNKKGIVEFEKSESGLNYVVLTDEEVKELTSYEYTPEMVEEIHKCEDDIIYFAENYCNIINFNSDKHLIKLFPKQKEVLRKMVNSKHLIINGTRQWGNTTMGIIYILWSAMFQSNVTTAYFNNKEATTIQCMDIFRKIYEDLPPWLKSPAIKMTKNVICFENGCTVMFEKYTDHVVRGRTYDLVIFNDFVFFDKFRKESLFPFLCLKNCKVFLMSVLRKKSSHESENWGYDLYLSSVKGENDWDNIRVDWSDIPERDEEWKNHMIKMIGKECWEEEFETEVVI